MLPEVLRTEKFQMACSSDAASTNMKIFVVMIDEDLFRSRDLGDAIFARSYTRKPLVIQTGGIQRRLFPDSGIVAKITEIASFVIPAKVGIYLQFQ